MKNIFAWLRKFIPHEEFVDDPRLSIPYSEWFEKEVREGDKSTEIIPPWEKSPYKPPWSGEWKQGEGEFWKLYTWYPYWAKLTEEERLRYVSKWNCPEIWCDHILIQNFFAGIEELKIYDESPKAAHDLRSAFLEGKTFGDLARSLVESLHIKPDHNGYPPLVLMRYFMAGLMLTFEQASDIKKWEKCAGGTLSDDEMHVLMLPHILEREPEFMKDEEDYLRWS